MEKRFLQQISEDSSLWHLRAFDVFPAVIAHEYWRLHELCEQGEPYGVYTQIKDVYEVTLKFAVLLACARGVAEKDEAFLDEVVCLITDPNLTFGSWEYIGEKAAGYYKRNHQTDSVICSLIQGIISFYKKHRIINWRNEKIGHGALGFAEDEDYKRDVKDHIRRIKDLFRTTDEYLSAVRVVSGEEILQGYRKARKISSPEEIRIEIEKDRLSFTIDPFVELMDNARSPENSREVFLFDSQNRRNLKATLQSYASGSREKKWCALFSELAERRKAANGPCMEAAVDSKGITSQEEDVINSLEYSIADHEFVPPESVLEWLQGFVSGHKQGVCLLRMSRGTGKSTFCAKLNCRYENPLYVDPDLDVRTYHIHRMQLNGAKDFEREIELQWSYSFDGPPLTRCERIVDFLGRGKSRAEAFIAFLTQIRDITRQYRHKPGILMVLDGIDEIRQEEVWSYLDFAGIQIPEGVYILASCRSQEELPEDKAADLQRNISRLAAAEIKTIERIDEDNLLFLQSYTDGALSVKLPEKIKKEIWRLADYRVLYLSMLYTLINSGESPENLLNQGGNVVQSYVELLCEKYGEKQSGFLRELLIVLSSFGEITPLTMRELSELTGNDGIVTLDMLGKIADISPMLKKEYGYVVDEAYYQGDNRYHIVNETVAQYLRNSVSYSEDYITECVEAAVDCVRSFAETETEADAAVWTSLMAVAGMFSLLSNERLKSVIGDESAWIGFVLNAGEKLLEKADVLNLKWIWMLISRSAEWLQKNQTVRNPENEFQAYVLLARIALKKGEAEDALAWIGKAELNAAAGDEYRKLMSVLLRAEALIIIPGRELEGEALINKYLKQFKRYDDLYIKANMTLIRSGRNREKLKVRGAGMMPAISTSSRRMYALLRIARMDNLTAQDRESLLVFVDEYMCSRYRDYLSFARTRPGKMAIRKKLDVLCRLILQEKLDDEEEQIVRMSDKSVFIRGMFCGNDSLFPFANAYLGKERAENVSNRIIDRMICNDKKGMIADRSFLGRLILQNANNYAHDRVLAKMNIVQLHWGLSIFTALKNKGLLNAIDFENMCRCQYLIKEYELKCSSASKNDSDEIRRGRRQVAEKRMTELRSLDERLQTSRFMYYEDEINEWTGISNLRYRYSDVLCDVEKDELSRINTRSGMRKKAERLHKLIFNKPLLFMVFIVLWLLFAEGYVRIVMTALLVFAVCLSQYLVNYAALEKVIMEKKYLRHVALESTVINSAFVAWFACLGIGLSDFPTFIGTEINSRSVFTLILILVVLILMGAFLAVQEWPFVGLFRIWRKIRKWPDTLPQFK